MFDKIEKKVDEVRQKPENIRMRYVWFWTIICMLFIIFVWVMSMQITFFDLTRETDVNTTENQSDVTELQTQLNNIETQPEPQVNIDDLLLEQAETIDTEL